MKYTTPLAIIAMMALSCTHKKIQFDASGTFEAVETIVSAEASGLITALDLEEGQPLQSGQIVGYIDSTQLYLKKRQLEAQIRAVLGKTPDAPAQLAAYQEELNQALREQQRNANLIKDGAITGKQMDDANTQVELIKRKIQGLKSSLTITTSSLTKETQPLAIQIEQLNDQLGKCKLINRVNGTVLTKYIEANEVVFPGKPVYKIADLSTILLRAYLTGNQLSEIKNGMKAKVWVSGESDTDKSYDGTIAWISSKAEFTPKTIQTRDERANLVYPVKISVKNDGYLKIGMYADITFIP